MHLSYMKGKGGNWTDHRVYHRVRLEESLGFWDFSTGYITGYFRRLEESLGFWDFSTGYFGKAPFLTGSDLNAVIHLVRL
jgi:hypothetical protein